MAEDASGPAAGRTRPAVSVIVPVYNLEGLLSRCLDSLLQQSFTEWEAVCVDDGSTDASGSLLDSYAARDSRFRVFHRANEGVNFARQFALGECRGDWIASVDGDDWVESDFLLHLYEGACRGGRCDMVWTDYYRHESGGVRYMKQDVAEDAKALQCALIREDIWATMWCRLYSRAFIEEHKIGFPVEERIVIAEDTCFNLAFLSFFPKVRYLNVADYHYVIRDGSSVWSKVTPERTRSMMNVIELYGRYCIDAEVEALVGRRRAVAKFEAYDAETLSDAFFYSMYPEIRDIRCIDVFWWHKVLFYIAVRGWRGAVLRFLRLVRRLRLKA